MQDTISADSHTVLSSQPRFANMQEQLLHSVRQGSREAFAELWEMHFVSVVRSVRPLAHGDAEDIASEAFLITWQQLDGGEGPHKNFRAYVCGVAKNLARQHYRNYRQKVIVASESLDALAPPTQCPESLCVEADEWAHVRATLGALPARWREVLYLQHIEQVSRIEIGMRFGVSVNAVSALSGRARSGFKSSWLKFEGPSH